MSDLANYVKNELYEKWLENRKDLAVKWQENIDAFLSVSNGVWKTEEGEDWRSDTFIDYTRQKILSGFALIIDAFLQGGKIPLATQISPWDDEQLDDMDKEVRVEVEKKLEDMQKLIETQLADCNADRKFMKSVLCAAIYGEAISKQIVTTVVRDYYEEVQTKNGVKYVYTPIEKTVPGWDNVNLWDFVRDLENDDLTECAGMFHRQMVSPYWLRSKMGQDLFDDEAILSVLEKESYVKASDANTKDLSPSQREIPNRINNLEYLEFWGRVPRKIVEEYLISGMETDLPTLLVTEDEVQGDELEVMCCIVGDEVVRFAETEASDRPFARVVWEMSIDDVGARGVADNCKSLQKVYNGCFRAIDDNTRLNANTMVAVKERFIEDSDLVFRPGAKIKISDDCDDVRKAIMPVTLPDITQPLYNLIDLVDRLLDESSGIPKIAQGQAPTGNRTDTAYEISQQVEKSGKYIGAVIKNFDEGLVEVMLAKFYRYNMIDPDCTCKGNYQIKSLGFTSFQDRIKRLEKLMQLLNLIMENETLMSNAKVRDILEEIVKALDIDPDRVLKTVEELQAEAEGGDPERELALQREAAEIVQKEAEAAATKAGIAFDQEKLQIERAKVAAGHIEKTQLTPTPKKKEQGPYIEKGLKSNNLSKGGVPV